MYVISELYAMFCINTPFCDVALSDMVTFDHGVAVFVVCRYTGIPNVWMMYLSLNEFLFVLDVINVLLQLTMPPCTCEPQPPELFIYGQCGCSWVRVVNTDFPVAAFTNMV